MDFVQSRAPGRVNLIGEHTDYNDGFVLPCAIAYETRVAAAARPGPIVHARSGDAVAALDLEALEQPQNSWSDYVRGVLAQLRDAGVPLAGADLAISGTVPIGAGLSSSASLEIAVALAMLALARTSLPPLEIARLAQHAEIAYVGTRCGIMDQVAVLCARAGHAIFLDTRSLAYELIPVPEQAAIVVCNTMVKHELSASAYNERRSECERSVEILRERWPSIRALRDVSVQQLEEARDALPPVLFRRAHHVVTENDRVVNAVDALRAGDLPRFGALMNASHESLRADYEVSSSELDVMTSLSRAFDGVLGARMTGGGFGGCTVTLLESHRAAEFRRYIAGAYRASTGITPEIYDGTPSAGASIAHE
jgi:galactokinase